mgnify:CR=1 FL=1
MPNLKLWIEAQLKRGYSIKQIKSILIRKGYPPAAVAEVDKIARPSSTNAFSSNKIPKNIPYKPFIVIIIIIGV